MSGTESEWERTGVLDLVWSSDRDAFLLQSLFKESSTVSTQPREPRSVDREESREVADVHRLLSE